MKATLTIKVPDDFERYACEKCPLAFLGDYTCDDVCVINVGLCPLEIQGKLTSINGYNAKECSDFISKYLNSDEIHYYDDCGNKNELAFILYSARDLLDYYSDIGE